MKLFAYATFLLFSINSYALEINSLSDIPKVFNGKTGNLINVYDTNIEFQEPTQITSVQNHFGQIISNTVKGKIKIGDNRRLEIKRVLIQKYKDDPKFISLKIFTTDDFAEVLNFELRVKDNIFKLSYNGSFHKSFKMILIGIN